MTEGVGEVTAEGQGQGPLNDPRLIERRGDLSGLNAALFVILVIVAFAAAAYLLATVLHIGGAGASPTAAPSVAAQLSPAASGSAAVSQAPSSHPSTSSAASPSAAASATLREPLNIIVGGRVLGTVTVNSAQYPASVGGRSAGSGLRWLVTHVRYAASAAMPYGNEDWIVEDAGGNQHAWAGTDPKPALGSGTLAAGRKAGGNVTFKVPQQGTLWLVFSAGDAEARVQLPAQ